MSYQHLLLNQYHQNLNRGDGFDFEEDFTGDGTNWDKVGTNVSFDTTNDEIDFKEVRTNTNETLLHDLNDELGATISDTAWLLRTKFIMDSETASAGANIDCYLGIFDVTGGQGTNQDSIALRIGITTTRRFQTHDTDGQILNQTEDSSFTETNIPLGSDRWLEMIRATATTGTMEVFSDAFTTSLEQISYTPASTMISLRYLGIKANDQTSFSGDVIGRLLPNLQFIDGQTTPP